MNNERMGKLFPLPMEPGDSQEKAAVMARRLDGIEGNIGDSVIVFCGKGHGSSAKGTVKDEKALRCLRAQDTASSEKIFSLISFA